MDETEIKNKLNDLAELHAQADILRLDKQKLIDAVITDEIKEKLDDIETEFSEKLDTALWKIADLEAQLRKATMELGKTVKGEYFQAVWIKGRTSWDTKMMDGYSADHPEILFMRKEGDPSVSLRKV